MYNLSNVEEAIEAYADTYANTNDPKTLERAKDKVYLELGKIYTELGRYKKQLMEMGLRVS